MKRRIVAALLVVLIIVIMIVTTQCTDNSKPSTKDASSYVVGVWNNAEFSKPASEWTNAAKKYGSENGLIDLTVAQAQVDGFVSLKFPFKSRGVLYSATSTDLVEKYLSKFESEGIQVILSIQPLNADIKQIIGIVLSRYSSHKNIIGINVDIEWKESGTPYHVSNEERDIWLKEIKKYNNNYKLFLTYFKDYTYFPDDHPDIVILYDGEAHTQTKLLSQYQELAKHYSTTGIYTGYLTSIPPAASVEQIINAAPNTKYIIHTYDVFSERRLVIFQMDDVQVDWLESLSIDLINLHIEKKVPVLCSVIPNNLNNPDVGGGYLPIYLKNVSDNYSDLAEIGQHGYTHSDSERLQGMSYEEQKEIIERGLQILGSLGIKPSTFVPPFGSVDNTTVKVTKDLGFQNIIDLYSGLSSNGMLILNDYISFTSREGNNLTIKTPEQIMGEIDQKEASGCIIVLYQFHDFQRDSENKLIEFANILDVLKNSGKYVFITPRQYKEYFAN
jgi:peptidoglycan/xylan/chitin deacetylase (PgdA/CDA1 family)